MTCSAGDPLQSRVAECECSADAERRGFLFPFVCGFFVTAQQEALERGAHITNVGGRHVRPGAMAGSLILVPFYMCMLGLMLCGSVADSRAVFFTEQYEPAVPEEYGIDDGPQTFTMQDHFNYLRERELMRRRRGDSPQLGALEATSHIEEEEQPIFVSDYCLTGANTKNDP